MGCGSFARAVCAQRWGCSGNWNSGTADAVCRYAVSDTWDRLQHDISGGREIGMGNSICFIKAGLLLFTADIVSTRHVWGNWDGSSAANSGYRNVFSMLVGNEEVYEKDAARRWLK